MNFGFRNPTLANGVVGVWFRSRLVAQDHRSDFRKKTWGSSSIHPCVSLFHSSIYCQCVSFKTMLDQFRLCASQPSWNTSPRRNGWPLSADNFSSFVARQHLTTWGSSTPSNLQNGSNLQKSHLRHLRHGIVFTLWLCQNSYWTWSFNVIYSGSTWIYPLKLVIFHSYVRLPEGIASWTVHPQAANGIFIPSLALTSRSWLFMHHI